MIKILLTKAYPTTTLSEVFESTYQVESKDFISAQGVSRDKVIAQIPLDAHHYIVTSVRAAKAAAIQDLKGDFYCVGNQSADYLQSIGKQVNLVAPDAQSFLNQIEQVLPSKSTLVYFCSNIRKDTLPLGLQNLDYPIIEIVTYQIIAQKVNIDNDFDAIAFFSPSGVKSFIQQYTIPKKAIIFALGVTTAEEVYTLIKRKAIIPQQPNFDSLIENIKAYWHAKK